VGRLKRVRRLHQGGRQGARRHEVQGLVMLGKRSTGWRRRIGSADGFTLIELLVVIALVSILASMAIVQYRNSIQSAKEATLKNDLYRMRDAIDQYYADKNKYPSALDTLVSDGYLRKVPEDPITKSADTWLTEPAEPDPSNPSAEPGVYNVKSGAQGQAQDGSAYSDW